MKTKHKILSVLAILAILSGLWVVVAAPASAVAGITNVAVTVTPNTANSPAQYSIAVTVGANYTAGTDYFTVTFPEGTQLPSSFAANSVTVLANGGVGNPAASPVIVAPNTVRVYVPATTLASTAYPPIGPGTVVTITFISTAGIENPTVAAPASAGKYVIKVAGSADGVTAVSSAAYAITNSLVVSPTHAKRGATVTLSGSGFSGTLTILNYTNAIRTGGSAAAVPTSVNQTPTASDGTFSLDLTITSPNFLDGANTIVVRDGTGNMFPWPFADNSTTPPTPIFVPGNGLFFTNAEVNNQIANVTVDPSIVATPASAGPGATITITLVDFPSGDTFGVGSVKLQGIPCSTPSQSGTVLTVTLPTAAQGIGVGTTTLTVLSTQGHTASASFSVLGRPTQVNPATASIGATITIQGQSYKAGGYINSITLAGVSLFSDTTGNQANTISIDASGNFVGSVVLNGIEALQTNVGQAILVNDSANNKGGALFTVMPRAITISPTSSALDSVVSVSGTGFRVDGYVNVGYTLTGNATPTISVFASCDGNGSFNTTIKVPTTAGIPSTNTITASDNVNPTVVTVSATHKVPGATITVSPASAAIGTMVTINGSGFAAYKTLSTLMIGIDDVRPSPTPYTDANGSFTATVMVAGQPLGTVAVTAKVGTTTATTALTISAAGAANTVTAGLAVINGKFDQVWTLDAGTWKGYDPSDVANADFNTVAPGMALYIHTTEAVSGVSLGGISRDLISGWNLIGWVS